MLYIQEGLNNLNRVLSVDESFYNMYNNHIRSSVLTPIMHTMYMIKQTITQLISSAACDFLLFPHYICATNKHKLIWWRAYHTLRMVFLTRP